MTISRYLLPLLLASFFAFPAMGQRFDYLSIYSGGVFLSDYRGAAPGPVNQIGSFSDGWLLGGAIGKNLCNCNRIEAEFFYRNNGGDTWTGAFGPVPWDGRLNSFSSMGNLLHDFRGFGWRHVTPYIGAGCGAAYLDGELASPSTSYTIDETVFAYQGILGAKTQLTCRLSLLTEYRYFGTSKTNLVEEISDDEVGTFGYDSHNVLVGLSLSR